MNTPAQLCALADFDRFIKTGEDAANASEPIAEFFSSLVSSSDETHRECLKEGFSLCLTAAAATLPVADFKKLILQVKESLTAETF